MIIPLQLSAKYVVLAGDHKQLPAVVFDDHAKECNLERSLLQRYIENGGEYVLLTEQYRMAPSICKVVSLLSYGDNLVNSAKVLHPDYQPAYLTLVSGRPSFKPLFPRNILFVDLPDSWEEEYSGAVHEEDGSRSRKNQLEAFATLQLLRLLRKERERCVSSVEIGTVRVLTPYQGQKKAISALLDQNALHIPAKVTTCTVREYQGEECNVVLFSTVIANRSGRIQHSILTPQMANVAFSRARQMLIIVGNKKTLAEDAFWSKFFSDSTISNLVTCITVSTNSLSADGNLIKEAIKEQLKN